MHRTTARTQRRSFVKEDHSLRRLQVLYVQHAEALGGSAVSLQLLIRGLQSEFDSFEPHVLVPSAAAPELTDLYVREHARVTSGDWTSIDGTVAAFRLRDRLRARMARAFRGVRDSAATIEEAIKATTPDLVHLNSATLAAVGEYLLEEDVPFVWHVREPPDPRLGGVARWTQSLMACAPAVIFLSQDDRSAWLPSSKAWRNTYVVPNAVDTDLFYDPHDDIRSAKREELGLSPTTAVALYVGGLNEIKGAREMLLAAPGIQRAMRDARILMPAAAYDPSGGRWLARIRQGLQLLGRPTFGDELRAIIDSNSPTVMALPPTAEVHELFAASDVVVFPSLVPHFARPVIEAMAAGKCVVASDLPGVRELIRPFPPEMSSLVPSGDVDALTEALVQHLDSSPATPARHEAQSRARAYFGLRGHARAVHRIYRELVS